MNPGLRSNSCPRQVSPSEVSSLQTVYLIQRSSLDPMKRSNLFNRTELWDLSTGQVLMKALFRLDHPDTSVIRVDFDKLFECCRFLSSAVGDLSARTPGIGPWRIWRLPVSSWGSRVASGTSGSRISTILSKCCTRSLVSSNGPSYRKGDPDFEPPFQVASGMKTMWNLVSGTAGRWVAVSATTTLTLDCVANRFTIRKVGQLRVIGEGWSLRVPRTGKISLLKIPNSCPGTCCCWQPGPSCKSWWKMLTFQFTVCPPPRRNPGCRPWQI